MRMALKISWIWYWKNWTRIATEGYPRQIGTAPLTRRVYSCRRLDNAYPLVWYVKTYALVYFARGHRPVILNEIFFRRPLIISSTPTLKCLYKPKITPLNRPAHPQQALSLEMPQSHMFQVPVSKLLLETSVMSYQYKFCLWSENRNRSGWGFRKWRLRCAHSSSHLGIHNCHFTYWSSIFSIQTFEF